MNPICVVVADAKYARFFIFEPGAGLNDRGKLVQRSMLFNPAVESTRKGTAERVKSERASSRQAEDVQPMEVRRQQHRLELERRFGSEIARQTSELVGSWREGTVVLIADPHLLGLMRETVRDALKPSVELKELAKDYVSLSPEDLHDQLAGNSIVPPRRSTA